MKMNTMNHFDINEWRNYITNDSNNLIRLRMEEHLLVCEECLELYMNVCEEMTNYSAIKKIHPEFVDKVMKEIKIKKTSSNYLISKARNRLITYYVVAACMTMLITITGTFDVVQRNTKEAMTVFTNKLGPPVKKAYLNGWSERLTDRTKNIIKKLDENI